VHEVWALIKQVSDEYTEFKKTESNMILFGRQTDMDDIRNANMHMRVVPTTDAEFQLLQNPAFVPFLSIFGVRRDPLGRG
jgi:hypothetical protein